MIEIHEYIGQPQVVRNFIVSVGEGIDWGTSSAEIELLQGSNSIPPKFVMIPTSDIPGIESKDEDGHHDIYAALFDHFELNNFQKLLWEEGLIGHKNYVDPVRLLKAELDVKHGIDPNRVYIMSYQPHEGCNHLEEEDADGEFTDCIGRFLAQVFSLGTRISAVSA